jgi:hypothetical protein
MRVEATGPGSFRVEWEGVEELRAEQGANLAAGGLLLRPAPPLAPFTPVALALRIAGGGTVEARAQVVGAPAGALALHLEGNPAALLAALEAAAAPVSGGEGAAAAEAGPLWERLRALTPPQKILLAPKADRVTRALLVQDSDPQVLFALLKNPRLSIDEVVRIAKSSFLSFQAAELILKTSPWMSNLDVRLALVQNAKTPVPFALRILPTLPDGEVRAIAKGAATSMALRQAAIKRVTGG